MRRIGRQQFLWVTLRGKQITRLMEHLLPEQTGSLTSADASHGSNRGMVIVKTRLTVQVNRSEQGKVEILQDFFARYTWSGRRSDH